MPFYDHAVGAVRAYYDRRLDSPATPHTDHYFPNAGRFIAAYPALRHEALAIRETLHEVPRFHDLMRQQIDLSAADGRDWRMFVMKAYGVTVEENLRRCPTVATLLGASPEVVSCVLSFLAPHKHIPAHRGPFRGILRFHLMLSVPLAADGRPACELNIDGKPYHLADGESLLWDDTFRHEVWNRSGEVRVALLLDVWRKNMPTDVALISRALMAAAKMWIRTQGVSYGG